MSFIGSLVALALICIVTIQHEAEASVSFKSLECVDVDADFIDVQTCELKLDAKGQKEAHFYAVLKKSAPDCTFVIHAFKNVNNAWVPAMSDIKVDFCSYMENISKFPMIRVIHDQVKAHTNINHTCPYKKGETLIIDGLPEKASLANSLPLDSGDYRGVVDFTVQNKIVGKLHVTGTFTK